jgi:hypothetical protein
MLGLVRRLVGIQHHEFWSTSNKTTQSYQPFSN